MHDITFNRRLLLQGAGATALAGALGAAVPQAASAAHPTLRVGSRGAAVTELQSKLAGAGFWLGTPDGSFGALTQQAVYAIQKYHGLSRDGVVGPATWAKVDLRRRAVSRYGGETHIEINKAKQLLLVYSAGAVQLALNTSTGSNKPFEAWGHWYNGQTPSGTFRCSSYKTGWYTNALGGLYRPMFFNGGIAVHGSTSIPPYNASHGCCRLSVQVTDHLYARGYLALRRLVYVY